MNRIVVTVLVENSVQGRGLLAEHGLSFHVQAGPQSLLFDTGQSGLVVQNARQLGVDLSALDAIALSHGHYDHTGGLPTVLEQAPDALVFLHPQALEPHFARNPDGSCRNVGMAQPSLAAIHASRHGPRLTRTPTEVLPGIVVTGEIPRDTACEDVGGPFVLDPAGTQPDPITDDQALFFDAADGLVVLLGCAHAGVVNTLDHIRRLRPGRPVQAVLGGLHLLSATPERMARTVEALRDLAIPCLAPAHCTGVAAAARLWHEFPNACAVCSVGSRLVFNC